MQYRRSKNEKFKSSMDESDDDENGDEQVKRAPPVAYNELYETSDNRYYSLVISRRFTRFVGIGMEMMK